MPRVESSIEVPVARDVAFAVSQTTGNIRLRWDPFIRSQYLLDGAVRAAKGVQTRTRSRHGFSMTSEYTSVHPPERVGMKMVEGPWFFERFGGGWIFEELGPERTRAVWRYTFTITPSILAPVGDRIGRVVLGRDIDRRIEAFAKGCLDPVVVDAAREMARGWTEEN